MAKTSKPAPVTIEGKAFVTGSGKDKKRFMVRGVALSPNSEADLLADNYSGYFEKYVLPQLQYLNVNVVRVYRIDETQSHKKVMSLLAKNNIYVAVGLATPHICVNRIMPEYTAAIYNRYTKVAEEFCTYPNTFTFSVGNEVVFPGNIYEDCGKNPAKANAIITKDAAVMKSIVRDLKKYMRDENRKNEKIRIVPVGMDMQDGPSNTVAGWGGIGTDVVAAYYAGGEADERADYIGINTYRYVNGAQPGPMNSYDGLAQEVAELPVPVYLAEAGGLEKPYPRDWAIVPEMYSEKLLYNNLSGEVAFQFFNKHEDLGLYTEDPLVGPNPFKSKVTELSVTKYGGTAALSAEFGKVKENIPPMPQAVKDPSKCPAHFNPALLPCPAATISITVQNYADLPLKAVQDSMVIADLPVGSATTPSSTAVMVSASGDLLIQNGANWDMVCKVAASQLKEGLVVKNNVSWGNVACNIG